MAGLEGFWPCPETGSENFRFWQLFAKTLQNFRLLGNFVYFGNSFMSNFQNISKSESSDSDFEAEFCKNSVNLSNSFVESLSNYRKFQVIEILWKLARLIFRQITKFVGFCYLSRNFTVLLLWNFCKTVILTVLPKLFLGKPPRKVL